MGKAAGRTAWRIAALSVLLGAALAGAAAQAQAVTIHELYPGLIGTGGPDHIVAGPDGNLWFTGHNEASIDRITPGGVVAEFFLTPNSNPASITAGPNGKLWFSEPGWDRVGRISTAGSLTEFASNGIEAHTAGIIEGAEGDLWFAQNDGAVGRITTSGVVTQFSEGITQSNLHGITLGPEDNLWFTEGSKIGRITPSGVVTEFSEGITVGSEPWGITTGPDGNLWFTESGGDRIGRITPSGVVSEFSEGITPGSEPLEIAAGPDGNLWFTERAGDRIGRITPGGVVSEFSEAITPGSEPGGITAGPEDSMWFTEASGQIGQVDLAEGGVEPPQRPTVVTGNASSVSDSSSLLHATVNPNGATISDCHFEYGTSEAYGSTVPCTSSPGAVTQAVAVSASLGGLDEQTAYHFRIVATSTAGSSYGADQTFTTTGSAPVPVGGMWVGVDAGGWPSSVATDVAGAANTVRLDTPSNISGWTAAGLRVEADFSGPYSLLGVSAVNQSQWVARVVSFVKANPEVAAIEVLNEPGGEWFWGPLAQSTENEAAYAHLLKAVHEALVANFGSARPLELASYDGGHDYSTGWGEGVWDEATNGGINVDDYVDGITDHPYAWPPTTAEGARANVRKSHEKTGLPVYITEVGWNTAEVSEAEQAADIYNFISWARSTGYVADVTIFNYRDYSPERFWGIERWENPAGPDGSKKPSYTALREAATGQPLNLGP